MKTKLLIVFLIAGKIAFCQFNRQLIIGVGGQFSKYNITAKNVPLTTGLATSNRTVTNLGFGLEIGYYLFNNLSISYKLVYQNWDADANKTSSFLNGVIVEKLVPIQNNTFFNVGIMPFYEIINEKKFYETNFTETNNHGCVFTTGFSFVLDENMILGTHVFRKFNAYSNQVNGNSSLGGFSVSVKYVFKNNLFKTTQQ